MKLSKELILHTLMKIAAKVGLDWDGDLVTFIHAGNGIPTTYWLNVKMFANDCAPIHNGKLHKDDHINTWEEAENLVKDIYNGKYRAIASNVGGCDISVITGRLRDVKA